MKKLAKDQQPVKTQKRKMKLQFHRQFIRITLIVLQLINPSLQWPEPEYSATPIPAPWPEQFHALLYMNLSSTRLQITNLWYDWPRGRNVKMDYRVEEANKHEQYLNRFILGNCLQHSCILLFPVVKNEENASVLDMLTKG